MNETVSALLGTYDCPEATVADLLCDRHDPKVIAFTFVEEDLSSCDLCYGELADRSRRLATVLADKASSAGARSQY